MANSRYAVSTVRAERVEGIVRKILADDRRHRATGAVYDRDGDYVCDLNDDHGDALAAEHLAVRIHRGMDEPEIRAQAEKLHLPQMT